MICNPDKSLITVVRQGTLVADPNGADDLKAWNSMRGRMFRPQRYRMDFTQNDDGTWKLTHWKISGGMINKDGRPGGVDGERGSWGRLTPEEFADMPWLGQLVQDVTPTVTTV